jgi:hypothetical protein
VEAATPTAVGEVALTTVEAATPTAVGEVALTTEEAVALTAVGAAAPTAVGAATLTGVDNWVLAGEAVAAALNEAPEPGPAFADGAVSSRGRPSSAVLSRRRGRRTSLARWTWSWPYPDR